MKDAVDEAKVWVRRLRMWGIDRVLIAFTIDSSVAFSFRMSHTLASKHGNAHQHTQRRAYIQYRCFKNIHTFPLETYVY